MKTTMTDLQGGDGRDSRIHQTRTHVTKIVHKNNHTLACSRPYFTCLDNCKKHEKPEDSHIGISKMLQNVGERQQCCVSSSRVVSRAPVRLPATTVQKNFDLIQ